MRQLEGEKKKSPSKRASGKIELLKKNMAEVCMHCTTKYVCMYTIQEYNHITLYFCMYVSTYISTYVHMYVHANIVEHTFPLLLLVSG